MISLDTNALVRMLIEDDENQARTVKNTLESVEKQGQQVLVLTEVLIETVWVLESVYKCTREDICRFLETIRNTSVFTFSEPQIIGNAIHRFKNGGDFADLIIVLQSLSYQAKKMLSFDKKLQKLFPGYVVETIDAIDYE